MTTAILLMLLGVGAYILSAALTRHYIERSAPGLIEADMALPKPGRNEEYLWERTAGTGMVPKWVSVTGLLAIPLVLIGVVVLLIKVL